MFPATLLRNWKWFAIAATAIALISAGAWFRGVLADRSAQAVTIEAQSQVVKELTEEAERMAKQDAADFALFENVEQQRVMHAAEQKKLTADLRRLREKFDAATQDCFNRPLPADYLERLLSED